MPQRRAATNLKVATGVAFDELRVYVDVEVAHAYRQLRVKPGQPLLDFVSVTGCSANEREVQRVGHRRALTIADRLLK